MLWQAPDYPVGGCRQSPGWSHNWHHIAAVFDAQRDELRLYFDGSAAGDHAFLTTVNNSDAGLEIGRGTWYDRKGSLGGELEEIRISGTARYDGAFSPSEYPFVCDSDTRALWHFDESAGAETFFDGDMGPKRACGGVQDELSGREGAVTGP
jgi:hypothetical protein